MTLSELSLRNAKRQAKDYLIYFVTVVMAAALLYAFNGLAFSQEVRTLAEQMKALPLVILLASIVVVCIFGWLVAYATGFMLSRRGRELGTYILIGLTNRQVAQMFFRENLAVGGCALAIGLVLGGLLYQALRAILMALFGLPYHFALSFSLPAVMLTAAYFVLIYLTALRKSKKRLRRMKIYDLIYIENQNEGAVVQSGRKRSALFTSSLILGVAGTLLLMARNTALGILGAACVIVFLFGFFISFASGVPAFFDKRPERKYRGQNLLIFRTLTAKLGTMGVLMAVISLIFTATIMVEGSGQTFNGLFRGRAAESDCFDLYFGIEGEERNPSPYLDYIAENIPVEQSLLYQVYTTNSTQVQDYVTANTVLYYYGYDSDPVLRYSDYAALRAIAGYPAIEPEPGRYLLQCSPYVEAVMQDYDQPITLGDMTLERGSIYTEHLMQGYAVGNGRTYILVVPDEAAASLPVHHVAYAAKTAQPVPAAQYDALVEIADKYENGEKYYCFVDTKANEAAGIAYQTAIFVFPMYYLALALTMTAATILTIQQLSEAERYRRQFELLNKLGMGRREMSRALRTQFAVYYAMPAVPPLLIGLPFVRNLAGIPEPGVMVGVNSPNVITAITFGLFVLIYAFYILIAYSSLKRTVLPD